MTDMMEKETLKPKATKKKAEKSRPVQKVLAKGPKKVSFEVWASSRGVKEHHKRGLRAFVKNPNVSRTLESWDLAFENY